MADRISAYLRTVDAPRTMPAGMRWRLEHTIAANTTSLAVENLSLLVDRPRLIPAALQARLTEAVMGDNDADIAAALDGVDAPRPVPPPMVARIEDAVMNRRRRMMMRAYQISGAAAVAILIVAGTVLIRSGGETGGLPNQQPRVIPPLVIHRPPTQTIKPPSKVLGVKEIRVPVAAPTGGARQPAGLAPESLPLSPEEQFEAGSSRDVLGTRAASSSQGGQTLDVLSAITTLINHVLSQIVPAAENAPQPDVKAPAPSAQRQTAGHGQRSRKPAVTKPAAQTPAKPATVGVSLLPAIGVPAVKVEVPLTEITISL